VLTLRACSRLSAGGVAGQAGSVLELLQAFARARSWILGVLDVDQVLLLPIGAGGADLVVERLQGEVAITRCWWCARARGCPPAAVPARPARRWSCCRPPPSPGRGAGSSVLDVDQVLLLLIGAGGADLVVERLQGEVAITRCWWCSRARGCSPAAVPARPARRWSCCRPPPSPGRGAGSWA